MPRAKIVVDKAELSRIIESVESDNKFTNRTELAEAVAPLLSVDVSPSVVKLRIKEFGIQPQTPKGKRGRQKGVKLTDEHKNAMQAGRRGRVVTNVSEIKECFPESRHKLIDKVGNGSLASAIKAMCLSCVQFQTKEIKNCEIKSCPLWSFRPYQEKQNEND